MSEATEDWPRPIMSTTGKAFCLLKPIATEITETAAGAGVRLKLKGTSLVVHGKDEEEAQFWLRDIMMRILEGFESPQSAPKPPPKEGFDSQFIEEIQKYLSTYNLDEAFKIPGTYEVDPKTQKATSRLKDFRLNEG